MSDPTCGSCAHWKQPSDRDDWRSAVSTDYVAGWTDEQFDAAEQAQQDADKTLGECGGVPANPTVSQLPSPAASVVDGSDYFARLYTTTEFFCALWRAS